LPGTPEEMSERTGDAVSSLLAVTLMQPRIQQQGPDPDEVDLTRKLIISVARNSKCQLAASSIRLRIDSGAAIFLGRISGDVLVELTGSSNKSQLLCVRNLLDSQFFL
jgi:hypothetical protein